MPMHWVSNMWIHLASNPGPHICGILRRRGQCMGCCSSWPQHGRSSGHRILGTRSQWQIFQQPYGHQQWLRASVSSLINLNDPWPFSWMSPQSLLAGNIWAIPKIYLYAFGLVCHSPKSFKNTQKGTPPPRGGGGGGFLFAIFQMRTPIVYVHG